MGRLCQTNYSSISRLVGAVDGCTVATQALADVIREHVRPGAPVLVVPNAIRPDAYLGAFDKLGYDSRRKYEPLTVGWSGTARLAQDFEASGIGQAWGAIARRYPDVQFVTIGGRPPALLQDVPEERVESFPMQDFETYPDALLKIQIACCPLAPTPFNACKSPQKAWEHALTGAAVVCSSTMYADDERLVECGGLLASNADEWEAHLSMLIENEQERRDRVASLQRFVLEDRSLEANLHRWPEAWRQIVSHARGARAQSYGHVGQGSKQKHRKAERQNKKAGRRR